ncbi:NAD(P)H-hydrate dehydratase [Salibacterium halotolerans]|uniref:Bifunctional NAD(P)H-hydrate repair enzyme n=1 Tax=Salibacterium halotolerans TaxID=1884432 RepID=A0A1I5XF16_9BACI|nr:NAD(P)H-hydrate dehydratase [Salibacterium halotolerans]SFQ30558.1 NAD(P)H-hydrate epimerase [Salibacterium halotolerans]
MQVVTGEEMRAMDRYAMDDAGMKEELLMENAGRAAAHALMKKAGPASGQKTAVLIGKGNNGGDGFVVSRVLQEQGWNVKTFLLSDADAFQGAASYHKGLYERSGFTWKYWSGSESGRLRTEYVLIVDAMLGTGVKGGLREPFRQAADVLNEAEGTVAAVDIPSGVPSGEDPVPETVVQADFTITLQCPKISAYLQPAAHFFGEVEVVDIGLPGAALKKQKERKQLWLRQDAAGTLSKRSTAAHKGDHGRGLLIGGSAVMPGAIRMAAEACLYSGAGLLTAAYPSSAVAAVAAAPPEVMMMPLQDENGYISPEVRVDDLSIHAYDAVAAGPGMGRGKGAKVLVKQLIDQVDGPLLFDADALYFLPENIKALQQRRQPVVLTPHPGEMARLAGVSTKEVIQKRFSLSRETAARYNCCIVLKGPNTLVTMPDGSQVVNTTGNEALARGGTGDILTGIMLGMLLAKQKIQPAVSNAVYLHGLAADLAVEHDFTSYAMASTDIISYLPPAFRSIISSR